MKKQKTENVESLKKSETKLGMSNKQLLAYFGHHKCATTWIHDVFTEVCRKLFLKVVYLHSHNQFDGDLETFIEKNNIDCFTYSNANIHFIRKLKIVKGFHVIRDPRDISVSSYFSHLYSHPTANWDRLLNHREKLQKVSKEEGLFLDMEFISGTFSLMGNWDYRFPGIMELKMEELILEPHKKFFEIFDHLGIIDAKYPGRASKVKKISLRKLNKILNRKSFAVLSGGRKEGNEDVHSHYRKGIAGDWVNHFTPAHKKFFKEKYNRLLIKLGYEKDDNW